MRFSCGGRALPMLDDAIRRPDTSLAGGADLRHDRRVALAIHLLGVPRVERDGQPMAAPRGHKAWGLLAYLIRSDSRPSRGHLAALLFEDAEDPLGALRWNLSELRRLLGDAELRGDPLELVLGPNAYVDVAALGSGSWAEAVRVPGLDRELLEGMSFPTSPAFEVWLATERRHLQAAAEAVLREAALARLAVGAAAEAADLAARVVRLNPLDENYQALLVRSLAAAGDAAGAARQAAACSELLRRELGVEPGPTLAAALRTVSAAPVARPLTGRAAALAQLEAGETAIGAGALESGLQCLRRAIAEADTTDDLVLRIRTRVALGTALVHAARGRDEEGATALHQALAVAEDVSPPLAAAACRELGYVEFLRGRYERAGAWLRRARTLVGDDRAGRARIATVLGGALSDTAHYGAALETLLEAETVASSAGDAKELAFALSMRGRVLLLRGELEAAAAALDRSVALAREQGWTAFVPWPQALRAEVDLMRGDVDAAAERYEHAFALACQFDDPCWEGIAGRGLGLVADARGDPERAVEILVETTARCVRMPDAYLWCKAYALDALCGIAVASGMPQASAWIDELRRLAARTGMRELTVRSYVHCARRGDAASGAAARHLASEIDNPALGALLDSIQA
jgi:DNA-binding SARP family transcriptional activator